LGGLAGNEGGGPGGRAADHSRSGAGHQVGGRKHLDDWLKKSN
jgi:hypothetical protein